jgi:hypothetical protein
MARKPNYRFERLERQRKKADRKAAKLEAKRDAKGDAGDFPGTSADETRETVPAVDVDVNKDPQTDD